MRSHIRRRSRTLAGRSTRAAFTLLEVMLVLVILAAIAGIAVVNIGGVQERAYVRTAKTELANLKSMLEQYRLEVGTYPNKLEDLHTQPSDLADPSRWLQLLKEPPKPDPWGRPYEYTVNGNEYELRSLGPDGKSGTEDDIEA
ncbi:MAG: type II secretion system protein GspG [Pirellulaceae bacterium]|nr:MAG: type II secretion system protein GspG [Pirellulaceae bacterium]